MLNKKILYIDLDGVIANFDKAIELVHPGINDSEAFTEKTQRASLIRKICSENPDIYHDLEPIPGAIEAVKELSQVFEIYFLSTPMWSLPSSFEGKRIWVEKHFGDFAERRLILTFRKDLNLGDYLIDDRKVNGAGNFKGEFIHFGSQEFENWSKITSYLLKKYNNN